MILIHPYARDLRNGGPNPKNYPYWKELIAMINEPIIQVGTSDEIPLVKDFEPDLPLENLTQLVNECRTWIGVDSFFQHFCWDLKKPGIVLWGQSDPNIFGHPENINLLKDRKYLRQHQFWMWEQAEFRTDCWVMPEDIVKHL